MPKFYILNIIIALVLTFTITNVNGFIGSSRNVHCSSFPNQKLYSPVIKRNGKVENKFKLNMVFGGIAEKMTGFLS